MKKPRVLSHRHTLYFNYWDLSWRFYRFRYTFLKAAHWVATQLGHQWGFGDIAPFIFYYHFVFCCFDGFSSQLLQIEDTSHHEGILSHYKAEASTLVPQIDPSVEQSRRRPLLGPSPGWKRLLALSHLRHYATRTLTPRSLNMKLAPRCNYHKGRAAIRHYANQPARPLWLLCRGPNFTLRDRGVNARLA